MIFDTHAHYDDPAFDADREELLGMLPGRGIGRVVDASSTAESNDAVAALTRRFPDVYGAYGIHPEELDGLPEAWLDRLSDYCRTDKAAAVGEIGLDYHWRRDNKAVQIRWFEAQLEIARSEGLPVIIHSRDAAADTMRIVKERKVGEIGGVMHCYSYSLEDAKQYLSMGLFLGIGGVVTFKNARKLKEVVKAAPISRLVLETDCPYLAPEPNRGKRNSSLNLPYVVRAIADLKGLTPEEVEAETWKNACRLYRMEEAE